jgi:hypothetical protein
MNNEPVLNDDLIDDDALEEKFDQAFELKDSNTKSVKQRQAEARLKLEDMLEARRLQRENDDYL